jgi:hypothetical protein
MLEPIVLLQEALAKPKLTHDAVGCKVGMVKRRIQTPIKLVQRELGVEHISTDRTDKRGVWCITSMGLRGCLVL